LEQLRHIDQRLYIQSVSIPHVEPRATPIVARQGVVYPQGIWLVRSVPGPSERSQVPHHKLDSRANQGVGTITYPYCYQMGHLFNHCPFVDDRLS